MISSSPIQQVTFGSTSSTANGTISSPGVGNTLVLCIRTVGTGTPQVSSVTGGGANWHAVPSLGGTTSSTEIWYGLNSSGSGTTITVNVGGTTVTGLCCNLTEWSGVDQDALTEIQGVNNANSTAPASGTLTIPNSNSLVICCLGFGNTASINAGPTNSFTALTSISEGSTEVSGAYFITNNNGNVSTGWTLSTAVAWRVVSIALREQLMLSREAVSQPSNHYLPEIVPI